MKHNKKRNTAFIYETLSRELARAIVGKDEARKKQVLMIVKEYFSSRAILAEELELYKALLDTKNVKAELAERILREAKIAHTQLPTKALFGVQSQVISTINKTLGKDVWSNFIPNFKSMASVNAVFSPQTSVKKRVLFEQAIVESMSAVRDRPPTSSMAPIDSLTYQSFIKKFNNKYGNLLQEQKDLLNQFITSFADDGFELRVYLNEELTRLKEQIQSLASTTEETLIDQKLHEVLEYLEEFRKRNFTDKDLNKILKTQELVQEMASNDHH